MPLLRSQSPRVLVVGDVILDHYVLGVCDRVSPEAPVPVVDVQEEKACLGGAANVMNNLHALGATVTGAFVVGDDQSGREIAGLLQERGISTSAMSVEAGRRTSRKTRVLASNHQIVRIDNESKAPISRASELALVRAACRKMKQFDAVLLSDYDKGVMTADLTRTLITAARREKIPILVDPKGDNAEKYRGADVITPNQKEAAKLTAIPIHDGQSLRSAGKKLRTTVGIAHVVVTLADRGMVVFGDSTVRIHAASKDVFDVSGAGDTVIAAMGYGLARGMTVPDAARFANVAAGVVVGKLGVATVTLDEIVRYDCDTYDDVGAKLIRAA